LDEFKNFEERGDFFKKTVKETFAENKPYLDQAVKKYASYTLKLMGYIKLMMILQKKIYFVLLVLLF
jgi:hypothetical protein